MLVWFVSNFLPAEFRYCFFELQGFEIDMGTSVLLIKPTTAEAFLAIKRNEIAVPWEWQPYRNAYKLVI